MQYLSSVRRPRKGQALVEYTLLIAGVALACALAVAVLGDHMGDTLSVMASIVPGAEATDNVPLSSANVIPYTNNGPGGALALDTSLLASGAGTDRYAGLLGSGGGATLVTDGP